MRGDTRGASNSAPFLGVLLCVFLSGFAALLYEVIWLRQFSVVFGTSEQALATVLAAYIGGLALGARLASGFVACLRHPLRVYALIELGIALSALAAQGGLELVSRFHARLLGGQPDLRNAGAFTDTLYYVVFSFLIIIVPTGLMGATLPLLTRCVVRSQVEVGARAALLYAVNTAGAVLGTLAAPVLLFLPQLGLRGTVQVGVGVNLLVFTIALLLARSSPEGTRAEERTLGTASPAGRNAGQVLPMMLLSGASAFTCEVLWTRLLTHLVGTSIFAFATMLSSFLAGISVGSALAMRFARTRSIAAAGFVAAQLGIAVTSILIYHGLDFVPRLAGALGTGEHAVKRSAVLAALVLLPAALCSGATFPFAVRILARDGQEAAPATARVYAWNTLGAVVGALLAGYVLIPARGFAGTAQLAVTTNLLVGAWAALVLGPTSLRMRMVMASAALVLSLSFRPGVPERLLRASPMPDVPSGGRLAFTAAGRSTTVTLLEKNGWMQLRTNGLPEAGLFRRGAPPGPWGLAEPLLSNLPVLARPEARSMLIIGFGAGIAVESAPPSLRSIDVVELEPEVIEANRSIASERVQDPLSDPRVRVVLNDARSALSLTTKRYDAIVSQPSHPWSGGASHLFTREFYELVRAHLEAGGVFVQWGSNWFFDEELLRTFGATFLAVFEHVRVYRSEPQYLLFVGSEEPLDIEIGFARTGAQIRAHLEHYASLGIAGVEDLAAMLALDGRGLAELCIGARPCTDDWNAVAVRAARAMSRKLSEADLDALFLPLDPLLDPRSELSRSLSPGLDRVLFARRVAQMKLWNRARAIAERIPHEADRLLATGMIDGLAAKRENAEEAFRRALALDPGCDPARYALVEPSLDVLAFGQLDAEVVAMVGALKDPAAAVVQACLHHGEKDWERLATLDGRLAEARPGEPWYQRAASLRTAWRVHFAGGTERRQALAEEALTIVDRALVQGHEVHGLEARLAAAKASDQPVSVLETASAMIELMLAAPAELAFEAEVRRRTLATLDEALEWLAGKHVPIRRLEEVEARLHGLSSRDDGALRD